MTDRKGIGIISARRVIGFGLDRFVSVMFLGMVPLSLDVSARRQTLFLLSLASVALVVAALVATGSRRGSELLARVAGPGPRTPSVAALGLLTAGGGIGCLSCISQLDEPGIAAPYGISVLALGLGSALLVLLWGVVFSRVGARTTLVEASLGYLLAFCALLPFYELPPAGRGMLVFMSVGANAALLTSSLARTQAAGDHEDHPATRTRPSARGKGHADGQAWVHRICVGLFLYGSAMACFGQVQLAHAETTLSLSGSVFQALAALIACLATLAVVLRRQNHSEVIAYRVAFVVTTLGCLLPLVFPPDAPVSMVVMLAGETTMLVVISSLLFEFAHQVPQAAIRVLSLGIASKVLGDLCTRMLIEVARGLGTTFDVGVWTFLFAVCIIAEYTVVLTEGAVQTSLREGLTHTTLDGRSQQGGAANPTGEAALRISAQFGLTDRESEILYHLLRGRSSRRIQEELFISESTANTHIRHIYAKVGIHSKQELLDLAEAMGHYADGQN